MPVVGWCSASAIYDTTDSAIYLLDFPILGSALSMMNDLSLPAVLVLCYYWYLVYVLPMLPLHPLTY